MVARALAIAIALLAALLPAGAAARTFHTVLEDDALSLFSTPATLTSFTHTLRWLGIDTLRISAEWKLEAPAPDGLVPPKRVALGDPRVYDASPGDAAARSRRPCRAPRRPAGDHRSRVQRTSVGDLELAPARPGRRPLVQHLHQRPRARAVGGHARRALQRQLRSNRPDDAAAPRADVHDLERAEPAGLRVPAMGTRRDGRQRRLVPPRAARRVSGDQAILARRYRADRRHQRDRRQLPARQLRGPAARVHPNARVRRRPASTDHDRLVRALPHAARRRLVATSVRALHGALDPVERQRPERRRDGRPRQADRAARPARRDAPARTRSRERVAHRARLRIGCPAPREVVDRAGAGGAERDLGVPRMAQPAGAVVLAVSAARHADRADARAPRANGEQGRGPPGHLDDRPRTRERRREARARDVPLARRGAPGIAQLRSVVAPIRAAR